MKKSLLPKQFKAGYRTYTITTSKTLMDEAARDHEPWDMLAGLTAPNAGLVWLKHKGVSDEYIKATLLHELMHVSVEMAALQNLLASQGKNADHEENYIMVIAEGLYTILMDNPHLREFLFGTSAYAGLPPADRRK